MPCQECQFEERNGHSHGCSQRQKSILEERLKEFVEKGADIEHDRWGHWQKYMMSKMSMLDNGDMVLPKEFVDRWFRQIDTPYSELSEPEKESDRKETRNYLPLITETIRLVEEETKREIMMILTKERNQTAGDSEFNKGVQSGLIRAINLLPNR